MSDAITFGAHAEGVETVLRAVGRATAKVALAIDEGLEKYAHVILRKSQHYVPVDTGDLKKSGAVEKKGKGLAAKAFVIYRWPYAIFVHENLKARHAAPTGAKFLERAVRETRGVGASIVRREIEARTKGIGE